MRRPNALVLLMIFLSGCGGGADQQLEQASKTLASWSATVQMTGEEFTAGRVPKLYVDQVLKAADEQLAKQKKQIDEFPDDVRHRSLEFHVEEVRAQMAALREQARGGRS